MIDASVTVAHAWWARTLGWIAATAAGAAVALLLRIGVEWVAGLSWVPLPGPLRLVAAMPQPQATIGAAAVGALVGLALAWFADQESLSVTVSPTEVTLVRPGAHQVVDRTAVATAFRDGDRLVLLGRTGAELAREPVHHRPARLAAAFAAHGIGWSDRDPYADAYRRWVPGATELSAGEHALLFARERALKAGDADDVAELRSELARLGVVVRDDKKRQYWRRVGTA